MFTSTKQSCADFVHEIIIQDPSERQRFVDLGIVRADPTPEQATRRVGVSEDVCLPFPPDANSLTSAAYLTRANHLTGALAIWADQKFHRDLKPSTGSDDEFKSALIASILHTIVAQRVSPDQFFREVLLPFAGAYRAVETNQRSDLMQHVFEAARQIRRQDEVARFMAEAGRSMGPNMPSETSK